MLYCVRGCSVVRFAVQSYISCCVVLCCVLFVLCSVALRSVVLCSVVLVLSLCASKYVSLYVH